MINTKIQNFTYLIKIAYDGSSFYGWAKQPKHITIEGEINKILKRIFHLPIVIQGASRTDRGVHAWAQFFTFKLPFHKQTTAIQNILTKNFPLSIKILAVKQVDNNFNLLQQVKSKTYQYLINTGDLNPFQSKYQYFIGEKLICEKMQLALDLFVGQHYFYNFSGLKSNSNKSRNRIINSITVTQVDVNEQIIVTIMGNGFLRYQIRYLVASAIDYAKGKVALTEIQHYLNSLCLSKYRFKKLPAAGLYLKKIDFKP